MLNVSLSPRTGGVLALVLAAVLLGTVGIAAALWNRVYPTAPLTVTLLRLGFSTPFLLILAHATPARAVRRAAPREWALVGALGLAMAASQSLFFLAIPLAGVTLVLVLSLCSAPFFVALLSIPLFHERLRAAGRVAGLLAILGTGVLVLGGKAAPAAQTPDYLLGPALALGCGAAYGAFLVLAKVAAQGSGIPRSHLLTWTFAVAFTLLLPLALATGTLQLNLPLLAWGFAVYMGIVPTGLAYLLLQIGLQSASATLASVITLLEIAVTAGLAWLLLGESLTGVQIGGALLLILSVVLLLRADKAVH